MHTKLVSEFEIVVSAAAAHERAASGDYISIFLPLLYRNT